MNARLGLAVASLLVAAPLTVAADSGMQHASVPTSPAWEKLKTLEGSWEGTMPAHDGKPMPTQLNIRMTGGGSALVHWIDPGSKYEMMTMFTAEPGTISAVHYCAAHNQPHMELVPGKDPNVLTFDFKDGKNLGKDGYMSKLVITFLDKDHHREEWTHSLKGEVSRFEYKRSTPKPIPPATSTVTQK